LREWIFEEPIVLANRKRIG